ncbi:helix-turn-helix domain-containing protein [Burkholderia stagnalis]|uniref:helix-turn-helix domain-containing protein n=1 Tax=Burkholderia stagnalis TaxID=1503054 RepID=UPI0009C05BBC|nr:AraC family transcriptional regulator [Burkholderia stagnalis]
MKKSVISDRGTACDDFRRTADLSKRSPKIGVLLFDGFSLRGADRFCRTFKQADTRDSARQADCELLLLSTDGGAVCSSSGIPVWTQPLSAHESACFAYIIAFGRASDDGDVHVATAWPQADAGAFAGEHEQVENPAGSARVDGIAPPHARISDRIRQCANWLRNNHTKRFSIAEVATIARMSERNFMRRFKQELGVRPSEFVRRIRLDEACQLLVHTDLPADKIARRTGFGTGPQMARMFRQYLEMSPIKYRNAARATAALFPATSHDI